MPNYNLRQQVFEIRLLETRYTISVVMSFVVAPWSTMTLWTRNLSLHCMSGGASRCACIVTESKCNLLRRKYNIFLPSTENLGQRKDQHTDNNTCRPRQDDPSIWPDAVFLRACRLHLFIIAESYNQRFQLYKRKFKKR